MDFNESLEYLLNLGNEVLAMKLGLENIRKVLDALGNPEKQYLKVQIAGTNGKGSTCAFLEAICVSAGINVGLTTSPHLVSITERIRINGKEISEEDFARHATKIREVSEKLVENFKLNIEYFKLKKSQIPNPKSQISLISLETVPTFFEQITAIALLAFAEAKCELVILETGLGGRFDATTAANAEIVAITLIDFDHQQILGETLAEIAAEKAAIIREDTRVVIAKQSAEAEKILRDTCAKFKVEPSFADVEVEEEIITVEKSGKFSAIYLTHIREYRDVSLSLLGKHQIENAKVAIHLAEILQDRGYNISKGDVKSGLQTAVHNGRLEFYKNILFDGAHNISGAKALKEYLDEFINQPITLVFGAMKDKDLSRIAKILFPKADKLILTKPDNPRSTETSELLKFVPKNFENEVFETETVAEALEKSREVSSENHLILVTGSLYLVGEAQKILKTKSES